LVHDEPASQVFRIRVTFGNDGTVNLVYDDYAVAHIRAAPVQP
jgi:hypothetical protein